MSNPNQAPVPQVDLRLQAVAHLAKTLQTAEAFTHFDPDATGEDQFAHTD